jgi:ASPIC and UnbV
VQRSIEADLYCTLDGKSKSYCTPDSYKGTVVRLWHNRGNGTFEDATSYLSASELVLTFGSKRCDKLDTVEIRWPSGQVDRLTNVVAGETMIVTEGKGITGSRKYGDR